MSIIEKRLKNTEYLYGIRIKEVEVEDGVIIVEAVFQDDDELFYSETDTLRVNQTGNYNNDIETVLEVLEDVGDRINDKWIEKRTLEKWAKK